MQSLAATPYPPVSHRAIDIVPASVDAPPPVSHRVIDIVPARGDTPPPTVSDRSLGECARMRRRPAANRERLIVGEYARMVWRPAANRERPIVGEYAGMVWRPALKDGSKALRESPLKGAHRWGQAIAGSRRLDGSGATDTGEPHLWGFRAAL
jgi:hypothetical protein